jgi:oxalate decarboxylase/phosphoglucose isomerase-like protein (cupin superfamily)
MFRHGLREESRIRLNGSMVQQLQEYLNGMRPNSLVIVKQRHGQVVYVPPGWAHQVTNEQPCLKVAWDYYDPNNFGKYALVHKMASRFFGVAMSPDYVSINLVAMKALETCT